VFFTNSRIGLWPVRALEGWQADGPGPLARALRQRIDSLQD
jgi:branched-subunit amino acid aminotransferase/4-amino-4-deoxychorismate lyase